MSYKKRPSKDDAVPEPAAPPPDSTPPADWEPSEESRSAFVPSPAQRARLRYWDFFLYWVNFGIRKSAGQKVEDPGFRRNR